MNRYFNKQNSSEIQETHNLRHFVFLHLHCDGVTNIDSAYCNGPRSLGFVTEGLAYAERVGPALDSSKFFGASDDFLPVNQDGGLFCDVINPDAFKTLSS